MWPFRQLPKPIRCTDSPGYNIGTHNFEPRYDIIPPSIDYDYVGNTYAIKEILKAMTKQIYKCDICTWCGEIREREKS